MKKVTPAKKSHKTHDKQEDSGIEWFDPRELTPHPLNPKIHGKEQIEKLKKSLKAFDWTRPLLYIEYEGKKIVIAGHGILLAAKALKRKVKTHKLNLTYEQATAYLAADNRLAEEAPWDDDKLKTYFMSLRAEDLELTGFNPDEISNLMSIQQEDFELEDFIFDDVQTPCWFVIRSDVINYAAIKEHLDKLNIKDIVIEDSQAEGQ